MIITTAMAEKFEIPQELIGADVRVRYSKKGGILVCPDCKKFHGVADEKRVKVASCDCGAHVARKYAVPSGLTEISVKLTTGDFLRGTGRQNKKADKLFIKREGIKAAFAQLVSAVTEEA